ncbi:hypothetical protein CY34DRAFT_798778 [Suillus luteus UH-Slu-Lm8-n1]|uniref:Uncharacterized protein n=1 Tax=Suillus luteus UH-Slu-Lm8-n1 TaxID=930992 RepID=A0A0D0ACF1_9AGAM|nr:hypothetical protein CY34DRAFT_798778 [Suillus luteus UH-Slu-Lm8-n1]
MSLTFLQCKTNEYVIFGVRIAASQCFLCNHYFVTRRSDHRNKIKNEHSSNKNNRRAKPSIVIATQPVAASTSTTPPPRRVQHASHDPSHRGLNSWYFFVVHLPRTLVMVTNTAVCGQSIRLYV